MTQDEIIRMARELATRHGTRMCDENGETHGEELYCVGVDDIAEIIKQVAAKEREACLACYSPDDTATDWADKIRARNIDSVDVFPKLVEKTPESIKDCGGAQHHRYAGSFGD